MSIPSTSVLFISRCKYKFENDVVNHCHNFHHLIYVVDGSGALYAGDLHCSMQKNDMYIIPPSTHHNFQSDSSRPLCTIEVKALVNDPQLEVYLELISPKIIIPNMKIKLILEAMMEEATYCRPQYKEIITANFIELVMNLLRLRGSNEQENSQSVLNISISSEKNNASTHLLIGKAELGDDPASKALQYFQENYEQKIIFKELAQQLFVSQAHLCRVFTERYAISPMQYLNNWRIKKTKELLINTELSITEISEKVGFQSVHYLSRRFAAKEKVSPLQYRQMKKEIIELQIEEKYEIVDHKIVM